MQHRRRHGRSHRIGTIFHYQTALRLLVAGIFRALCAWTFVRYATAGCDLHLLQTTVSSFVVASQTIGGTRLMLHLRGVHYRGIEESEHQGHARAETQVGMQFADESFFAIQGSGDHL